MKGQKHLTIVIKLGRLCRNFLPSHGLSLNSGTSSIVDEETHEPLLSTLSIIVETAVKLHKNGSRVVIVSSGAIGVALGKMDLEKRPKHLPQVQVRGTAKEPNVHDLMDWTGTCCYRTVQAHEYVGYALWPAEAAYCSDTAYKE